jgi:hypothetical protein
MIPQETLDFIEGFEERTGKTMTHEGTFNTFEEALAHAQMLTEDDGGNVWLEKDGKLEKVGG